MSELPRMFPEWLDRIQIKYFNPIVKPLAGRMPGLSVIKHRGRTSGRAYETIVTAYRNDSQLAIVLGHGKTDWAKVMDEVIGPRQRDNAPIRVSVAVPAGATPPRVAGVPASAIATVSGGVAAPGIPLPTPKPFTVAAGNDGPAAGAILVPSSPSSADAAPKPGSIFRGKPLVIVPRPLAAPRP